MPTTSLKPTVERHPAGPRDSGLESLAWLMDRAFQIPGTKISVGLDAILGLLPVGGDVLTGIVQVGIVVLALHPGWVQTEMGGSQAQVAPADSVSGLLRVIDAATQAQSGAFIDWRGEPLSW